MKLSDVMGAANLAFYAEIGLMLFLAAFVAVLARVLLSGGKEEWARLGRIPFEGEDNEIRNEEKRS